MPLRRTWMPLRRTWMPLRAGPNTGDGLIPSHPVASSTKVRIAINPCPGGFQGAFGTGRTRRFGTRRPQFYVETRILVPSSQGHWRARSRFVFSYYGSVHVALPVSTVSTSRCVSGLRVESLGSSNLPVLRGHFLQFLADFG
jgi:hypothetical protein